MSGFFLMALTAGMAAPMPTIDFLRKVGQT